MADFIKKIPKKYHSKLILHSHYSLCFKFNVRGVHLGRKQKASFWSKVALVFIRLLKPKLKVSASMHNLQGLMNCKQNFDYIFLKPVFDRHNVTEFNQTFNKKQLEHALLSCRHRVFALGGVKPDRVASAYSVGFDGVVLQGSFWNQREKRMNFFEQVREACDNPVARKRNIDIKTVKIDMSGRAS